MGECLGKENSEKTKLVNQGQLKIYDPGYDNLYKILLVGDSGVGKSSILSRFADGTFDESYLTTVGVDFKIRSLDINGIRYKLQIWDTAGQERFRTITSSYYRGAHGIFIVYDVTDPLTFNNIKKWNDEIIKYSASDVVKILVGNKSEKEKERYIDYQDGERKASEMGIKFIETSAKTNDKVNDAFRILCETIRDSHQY